jgi:hypothetical protein
MVGELQFLSSSQFLSVAYTRRDVAIGYSSAKKETRIRFAGRVHVSNGRSHGSLRHRSAARNLHQHRKHWL